MTSRVVSRRRFCGGLAAASAALFFTGASRVARADEIPAQLQAELVTRLAAYDKNMRARSGDRVMTVVVIKAGDVDSERGGAQLIAALNRFDHIGALPHVVSSINYSSATTLAQHCKSNRVGVVFVTPALAPDTSTIRGAFDSSDILTIGPSAEMTKNGLVLGFELVASRPKLFINLPQATKQNVTLPADILKLMTVFR